MTGKHLQEIIERYRFTQREIAEKMGIKPQTLYERLKANNITTGTLESVAKVIGVSPALFYLDNADLPERDTLLTENNYLKELLKEKERTIQLLMERR